MWAILGLGNPGEQYCATRHNAGFWVLDALASSVNSINWSNKFGSIYLTHNVGALRCLLVKPQRFMNLSGEASIPLIRYFRIDPEHTIVVHDDLDLDPGVVRVKAGGGSGGHKGIENIIQHFNSGGFTRVRVGIGHPNRVQVAVTTDVVASESQMQREDFVRNGGVSDSNVTAWVLGTPRPNEKELLNDAVSLAVRAVNLCVTKSVEVAQREVNKKNIRQTTE